MSIIDSPPRVNSPIHEPARFLPRVALALVALVLVAIVLSLFVASFLLHADDTVDNQAVETNEETIPVSNALGEKYFGTVTIGQGSTVNYAVTGGAITSVDDIEIVAMPPEQGLVATILEGENGTAPQLEIEVPTDYPVGVHTLNFEITGESEVVVWAFTVTPR